MVVLVVEVFFVVMLTAEEVTGNILMIVNSVGILVCCVLTWREITMGRWLLVTFLAWRIVQTGVDMGSNLGTEDHRLAGSLILLVFYVAAGLLVASPLGRTGKRTAG